MAKKLVKRNAAERREPLTVVGIGASAGGLDPCRRFFTEMPADNGMAFVVIQHLDPTHKSEMASLLGRCTRMAVVEATNGARVEGDHVYVIPPSKAIAIHRGRLRLSEPMERHGMRMPIDFFFRSLAAECRERGVGIIFSGTGSDGTLGMQTIKEAGGLAIAQDPQTAEHEGMPRRAMAGGVDFVLSVEEMPKVLRKYADHPYVRGGGAGEARAEPERDKFQSILSLLRTRAKFDFGSYKRGTLHRRVQRRMSLRRILKAEDYLELLRNDADEVQALVKDLLICVTHFFREPDAWKILQEQAIRPLVAARSDDEAIRVWIPGCATGEEAYSLGMLLFDELSAAGKNCGVQIFASDVNREAFATARLGVYPESLAAEVPAGRLRRYFVREGENYRIRKELRDAVVFAEHNLLADPPFSKLDLISCRNLMIYLDGAAQKQVITLFHYALREGGYLFLGSAETVGEYQDLFATVSRKWRIYRRIGTGRSEGIEFPVEREPAARRRPVPPPPEPALGSRFTEVAQQVILDRYAPACIVIKAKNEILYTCGATQDYLKQPTGMMQTDLLAWLGDSARAKVRGAIRKARGEGQTIELPGIRIRRGSAVRAVNITVEALKGPQQTEGLVLITFRDAKTAAASIASPSTADEESLVHQLEDELKTSREDLQSNIDQLAASNEELKASNEEVTSVNEELQSTNEELETSKEELQSLNEELSTVNGQLQMKVDELEARTNDLNNLLSSTDIPTIFLDRKLQIKWFTASTTRLLRLRGSDLGRPIGDFAQKFTGGDLLRDVEEVLAKLTPIEREIRGQDGRWYLRRVLPYRAGDNKIDGVVITFVDVHRTKVAEEGVRRLVTVLRDTDDAITLQDFDGHILEWNRGAERMLGYTEAEAKRLNAMKLVPAAKRKELRERLEQIKRGEKISTSLESQRVCKDGRVIDVWLTLSPVVDEQGKPIGVATTKRDITQRKRDEAAMRELNQSLEARVAERTALAEKQAERLRELAAQLLVTEEQERHKLAADLHDNLVQILYVAKMKLAEQRSTEGEKLRPILRDVEELLGRANQAARSLSYQLSPPILHELGLIPALQWLAEEMKRLYRLEVKVDNDRHEKPLDERARIILFRAVRELLVNVAKHSGVHHAKLRIRRQQNQIAVVVEDRGAGIDLRTLQDPKKTHGLGLFSIRERLDYLGGTMKMESEIGKKTAITLTMPVLVESGSRIADFTS